MFNIIYGIIFMTCLISILFSVFLFFYVKKYAKGDKNTIVLAEYIRQGANVFLKKQNRVIFLVFALFIIVFGVFSYFEKHNYLSILVLLSSALFSFASGYIGMKIANIANCRVAEACRRDLNKGLRLNLLAGAIPAICVSAFAIISLAFCLDIILY